MLVAALHNSLARSSLPGRLAVGRGRGHPWGHGEKSHTLNEGPWRCDCEIIIAVGNRAEVNFWTRIFCARIDKRCCVLTVQEEKK